MILLTSYYDAKNERREAELLECRKKNLECKAFDRIHRFFEQCEVLCIERQEANRVNGKEVYVIVNDRMTYKDYFVYANMALPNGTIVCLANSDVWFDETLLNITDAQMDNRTFFACSRWGYMNEIGGWHWDEGYDKNAPISQDAWIFRTPINWGAANLDFSMGCMRCDNVLAGAMQQAGYRVLNPTLPGPKSLKIHHEHRSQQHNYGQPVPGAMILVPPCKLG